MLRQDRNCFGGGICIYVKENIASKQLDFYLGKETEAVCLEINIWLRKWHTVGLNKLPRQNSSLFLENSCFKGSPCCIDLIITNRKSYFKNTFVTATGIFDSHKLTAVSLKSQILKSPSKIETLMKIDSMRT